MSTVIGIDLGTTNTVVAVVRDGQAFAIADEHGQALVPSVVSFHPNGNVIVGRAAKDRRLIDPSNTIYSVKRLIGRSWDSEEVRRARSRFPFPMREGPGQAALVVARGETYTLPEISAFVLRKAKSVAEAALGTTVERAVITVPANFNDLQRAATKVAGRVAGLDVMRILNEPTAAALAYGYGKSSSERVAVYDFGGGTFDVTLLDLSDNVFEVLATSGNTFLGGDDIDLVLAERMCEQLLAQHRYDARADPLAFEQLRLGAESIKHQLSLEQEARVELDDVAHGPGGKPITFVFSMTRNELDRLIGPIVERTFDVCREALSIARLSASDFGQVLLVGGSTRIPLVRRRVEEFFNSPVKSNVSPDEVVAIGAAIQANALSGAERRTAPVPPAPNPAAAKRRSGTLPPGVRPRMDTAPGVGGIPDTLPFAGHARKATSPGLAPGSRAGQPAEPADASPGVFGRPLTPADPGATGRERARTGPGLGPSAQQARGVAPPTLLSASDAALRAQQQAAAGSDIPLPLVGPDPAGVSAQERTEDSVVALSDADITDVETTGSQLGLRALAAPLGAGGEPTEREPPLAGLDDDDEPTHVGEPKPARGRTMLGGLVAPPRAPLPAPVPAPPPSSALPPLPSPAFEPQVPAPPPWLAGDAEATPLVETTAAFASGLLGPASPLRQGFGVVDAPVPGPMQVAEPERMPLDIEPGPLPPVLVDVTPLTLSVETVEGFCDSIIERNATVPCERTRDFVTATDNQTTVRVRVSQGESSRFMENTLLGEVELSGLRPAPRGEVRISVTFALDANGMMIVSAKEVATGRATTTRVRMVGLPDAHQLAHMMSRQAARQTV